MTRVLLLFVMFIGVSAMGEEVTISGSLYCQGACLAKPKQEEHTPILYAIDGPDAVREKVKRIFAQIDPEKPLDAARAVALMEECAKELVYHIDPQSPALNEGKKKPAGHYCMPAAASAVTGTLSEKDGKRWIVATKIAPARLVYPKVLLAPDRPIVKQEKEPIVLAVTDKISLKCVYIPPGKFLMGTPFYMWPNFVEEYPHIVTLTRGFYLAEIPVTQEMWEAVMGNNPSTAKDPQLPVQDPPFEQIDKFCKLLSEKTGRKVSLPTDAQWEYAVRVGTSNPAFVEKFAAQNSSGTRGFKEPLKVKSKEPNAWGLYDLASCWWEITADRGMYNARQEETDPAYPPTSPKQQRSGRGLAKESWSLATHEFITEKGYAGQKFRVMVEEK